jgi:hypothetical protein
MEYPHGENNDSIPIHMARSIATAATAAGRPIAAGTARRIMNPKLEYASHIPSW